MKVRTLLVAGAAAAVALVPALAAHAAGLVSSCSTSAPTVLANGGVATLPDGGVIFAQGLAASGGSIGITGPGGYLYASGSASGGSIQGSTANGAGNQIPWPTTANGSLNVSASPGICIAVAGHGVSAP